MARGDGQGLCPRQCRRPAHRLYVCSKLCGDLKTSQVAQVGRGQDQGVPRLVTHQQPQRRAEHRDPGALLRVEDAGELVRLGLAVVHQTHGVPPVDERADGREVLRGHAEDGRVIVHEGLSALHSRGPVGERSAVDPRDTRVLPGEADARVELQVLPLGSGRRLS